MVKIHKALQSSKFMMNLESKAKCSLFAFYRLIGWRTITVTDTWVSDNSIHDDILGNNVIKVFLTPFYK